MLTWWVTSTRLPFAGRSEARARTSRVRSASSVRSRKNELSAGQGSAVPKARRAVSRHRHHWLDSTRPIGTPPEANAAPTPRAWAALLGEVALGGAIPQAGARRAARAGRGRRA